MTEQIFYVNSCDITQINRYQNSKKIILFKTRNIIECYRG
jgi:hypothetical protein